MLEKPAHHHDAHAGLSARPKHRVAERFRRGVGFSLDSFRRDAGVGGDE
jgi:hypothetical protein